MAKEIQGLSPVEKKCKASGNYFPAFKYMFNVVKTSLESVEPSAQKVPSLTKVYSIFNKKGIKIASFTSQYAKKIDKVADLEACTEKEYNSLKKLSVAVVNECVDYKK